MRESWYGVQEQGPNGHIVGCPRAIILLSKPGAHIHIYKLARVFETIDMLALIALVVRLFLVLKDGTYYFNSGRARKPRHRQSV